MRQFFRKYYQETIAIALIAAFWGGIWVHQVYSAAQATYTDEQASAPSGPGDYEPEPTNVVMPAN